MKITITLREVLSRCYDWLKFCEETGYSEWAVNEGGGDTEVSLNEDTARKYGLIRDS